MVANELITSAGLFSTILTGTVSWKRRSPKSTERAIRNGQQTFWQKLKCCTETDMWKQRSCRKQLRTAPQWSGLRKKGRQLCTPSWFVEPGSWDSSQGDWTPDLHHGSCASALPHRHPTWCLHDENNSQGSPDVMAIRLMGFLGRWKYKWIDLPGTLY